jgi:Superfamily II DNA/RNA helicases, SNF2 family
MRGVTIFRFGNPINSSERAATLSDFAETRGSRVLLMISPFGLLGLNLQYANILIR